MPLVKSRCRLVRFFAAAVLVSWPGVARAQVGALGAGVSSRVAGENRYENSPVFFLSALVMPKGQWAAGVNALVGGIGLGEDIALGKLRTTGVAASGYYGVAPRLTLGIYAQPYASTSFDCDPSVCGLVDESSVEKSGAGSVGVSGVFQFWRSTTGATKLGGLTRLWLPTAGEGLGFQGTAPEVALILTHQLERVTLNTNASITMPTDDADGESTVLVDGAAVLALAPTVGLSFEAGGQFSNGEHLIQLGPALRVRLGRAFLELGGLVGVESSLGGSASDFYQATVGLAFAR